MTNAFEIAPIEPGIVDKTVSDKVNIVNIVNIGNTVNTVLRYLENLTLGFFEILDFFVEISILKLLIVQNCQKCKNFKCQVSKVFDQGRTW